MLTEHQFVPNAKPFNILATHLNQLQTFDTVHPHGNIPGSSHRSIQAAREAMAGEPIVQMERERKIITDTFKMVAYRAETQLANLVGPLLPFRENEARKFMKLVFGLPADILPGYDNKKLVVRLHGMAIPHYYRVLATLCEVLNNLEVCYPGTELRLVLQATSAVLESR